MAEQETGPITIQNPELIAALMQQSIRDAQFTTNALIDSHRNRADRAEATLDAIRFRIAELFSGDYMPTEHAIFRALNPSDEMIQRFMPREEAN